MTLLLTLLTAFGADAVSLKAVRRAQVGFGAPSLTIQPAVSGTITASLDCGARAYRLAEEISPGVDRTLSLDGLPQGEHHCQGTLSLEASDGSTGQMPLSLDVEILPALELTVSREQLDLSEHTLTVTGSRPLDRVQVEVFGEAGAMVGRGSISAGGQSEVFLEWAQPSGEAITLTVTGWDQDDLPGKVELSPWSYAIPHEDVHFASGKHAIPPGEAHKLESAWADLQDVLHKYGAVVEVRLFVVGFTDTVGTEAANQILSNSRARAIASWFRNRGFAGPIRYQGLGESVLAVPTADQTDEPANRRALYLLAAEVPPISEEIPVSSWSAL